jgi:DNA invertase Pin-like site-specific DNA recombinase
MAGVNPQSSREELTQLSTNVVPTQTQMSGFVKNGKVDLHKCLDEVNRRASEIGCTDFECSLERFTALATENGKLTSTTAREAITILQGEMHGYYTNARREDYGQNVKGPDFIVEGLGNFQNVTHVEVKNPVGSATNEIKNRPGFQNLIQNVLKEGDSLVVTKIDRCARNTLEFLKLQDILFKRRIQFISLDLPYSEDLNINKLISITLSSIAEFETNRRKERQIQGIDAAKKAGKYRGRKTVIDDKLISEVKHLKQQKMLSVTQIVKITGRSRNTIYKVLKDHLGYVSNRLVKLE